MWERQFIQGQRVTAHGPSCPLCCSLGHSAEADKRPQGALGSRSPSLLSGLKSGLPASREPRDPGFPQSSPQPDRHSPLALPHTRGALGLAVGLWSRCQVTLACGSSEPKSSLKSSQHVLLQPGGSVPVTLKAVPMLLTGPGHSDSPYLLRP